MRCTPGARLALAFALACALAPAARADGPLGPGAPCRAVTDVTDAMSFDTVGFKGTKSCTKLCKKAGSTCAKHVNRTVSCRSKSIDDSTFFEIQVSCAGQKGAALKTCSAPLKATQKDSHTALLSDRDAALALCKTKAQTCTEACNAP